MPDPAEQLASWLGRAHARGAIRAELWTHGLGAGRNVGEYPDLADPVKAAAEIEADARSHGAGQMGEEVRYAIIAYNDTKSIGETFIEVKGRASRAGGGAGGLPPAHDTATALAHIVKGLNDALANNAKLHTAKCTACASWERLVNELSKRAAALEEQLTRQVTAQQRLLLFEDERRAIARRQDRDDKNWEAVVSKFDLLLPAIVNRFATAGSSKRGAPLANEMLSALFGSLDAQQIDELMAGPLFTPEQKLAIGELYTAYLNAHRRKTALNAAPEEATAVDTQANGAADASKDQPS